MNIHVRYFSVASLALYFDIRIVCIFTFPINSKHATYQIKSNENLIRRPFQLGYRRRSEIYQRFKLINSRYYISEHIKYLTLVCITLIIILVGEYAIRQINKLLFVSVLCNCKIIDCLYNIMCNRFYVCAIMISIISYRNNNYKIVNGK